MPIKPEEVSGSNLPTALRGYQREATDDFLMRVAHDYRQVVRAQQEWEKDERRLTARIAELEAQLAALEEKAVETRSNRETELERNARTLQAEAERLRAVVREHEQREELTRALLSNAQRSARELRESVRAECETLLKAAHRRAAEIEADAHTSVRSSAREIERLRKLETDLKTQLRSTLEAVIG